MALHNDPRMYLGGYERINLAPHVALYANLKAREQAREEAFDNYMRNLNKNINTAGMRNVDREAFEAGLKDWQQKGIVNRDKIRNPRLDNGKAAMDFQAGYQDLQNFAAESKTEEEAKKPIVEAYLDPNKRDRMNSDDVMQGIQLHDQPLRVYDPNAGTFVRNQNRKRFDISMVDYEPKPFEQDKYLKGLDDIKPSQSTEEIVSTDPSTMTRKVAKVSQFSTDDYDRMASRAVTQYGADKGFKKVIDEMWNDPNSQDVVKLNETFKKIYGTDIHDKGDLAAAYTIQAKSYTPREEKIQDNPYARSKALEELRQAHRLGLAATRRAWKKADKAEQDTWVDEYIDKISNNAKLTSAAIDYKYKDGSKVRGHVVPMDEVLAKAVGITEKNPGQLIVTDDGEYITAFFKTDQTYKPIKGADGSWAIDTDKTRRFDKNRLKLNLAKIAAGQKQTNVEMSDDEDDLTGSLD